MSDVPVPAFPVNTSGGRDGHEPHNGMDLRDYLAAKTLPSAMQTYAEYAKVYGWQEDWQYGVALDSYNMADAMLRARKLKEENI